MIRVYSEMFEPIPRPVRERVAAAGQASALLEALDKATKAGKPIMDWAIFAGEPYPALPQQMLVDLPIASLLDWD